MAASTPRRAPRTAAAFLVLPLALVLATAAPASAVTPKQAATKALSALGSKKSNDAVIVFTVPKALRAGSRVTQDGTGALVARVGRHRAFFFYEDEAPGRAYPHPGRVALVNASTGKAKVSRTIMRRPRINGRLPAFLRNAKAYRSSRYRVFDGSSQSSGGPTADPAPTAAAAPSLLDDPFAETLLGPNKAPKAIPQNMTVKQGFPKRITLTGTDENGDLLTFFISKQPLRGTLSGQPPDVTYTPNPGYVGPDHFTFKASDGEAESNAAQISIDVVPLGQPPVVTTSAGCTAYTEQAPAVVVDGQLTVSDPDDVVLDSARVRIAAGFQDGDDLVFTDQGAITGTYDDKVGLLVLSGNASPADYQAALSSVRYRNLSSGNATATKDIEFIVNDAGNDSAPATKQVCVTGGAGGANDPPTGEPGEGGLSYIENDGPIPVDGAFVVGDPDSANLSGATVKFVPLVSQPVNEEGEPVGPPESTVTFKPAEDDLAFTDQLGITGSYDDSTGILTLSGSASLADYETAIRAVTYENSSEDPSGATRRIQFQVTDSSGANSTPRRRDVFVTPVNDAPEVDTSEGSTLYTGTATAIDSALAAFDVDDVDLEGAKVSIATGFADGDQLVFVDQLGITGSYDSGTGVLTLSGTAPEGDYEAALRSVAFDHTGGTPTGERTVELTTNDGDLDSITATKHVEINDEPVLDTTDETLAYTENDGPVAVDPGLTASDPESTDLAGATVTISAGFATGEDELAFVDQAGISGVYDDSTGTLTLTGVAPVADYETALRSVTYENASDDPTTSRTITFQADDGAPYNNLSDAVARDVAITPVNDAPVVATSEGSTSYTEGDAGSDVDASLTVADVDDSSLEGAQASVASGFQAGDELAFVDQLGISGEYDTTTGVLTLTGTAPVADYEAALRSVQYRHTGDDPAVSKSVDFTVNDGELDSAAASKAVDVTPVNDAPAVATSAGSTAYTEGDAATVVDSALTVADADDASLETAQASIASGFQDGDQLDFVDQAGITGVYDSSTGILNLSGTATVAEYETALRSIEYRHTGDDPAASKAVDFTVNDGELDSSAASKGVDVTAVNDKPALDTTDAALAYTPGDGPVAVDDAIAASDADSAQLAGATVEISAGFTAADDELAFADQAGIAGAYDDTTGVLTLTGAAPVADYQAALRSVTYENSAAEPAAGTRTVTFQVDDGAASDNLSDPATRDVEITPADANAPVVKTSAGTTSHPAGGEGTVVDDAVTVTDADDASLESGEVRVATGFEPGDSLTFVDQLGIAGVYDTTTGILTLTGTATVADYQAALRTITYSGESAAGARVIEFTVNDGDSDSNAAQKALTIVPVVDE